MKASKILHVGKSDGSEYPLAKKKQSMEYLREIAHLRPRTNTIGAVARIRNALAYATHKFFQDNGFLYVHTPIITASDCEGAGEMFQVTTLLSEAESGNHEPVDEAELESLRAEVAQQGNKVKDAKAAAAEDKENKDLAKASKKEVKKLLQLKESLAAMEEKARVVGGIQRKEDGSIDYSKDFFGKPSYLTVSGQLNGEYYACGLSNIYTFGPTFRAENSHTARHLAEFWMIEPEMAFFDLNDNMDLAEKFIKSVLTYALENCQEDLTFLDQRYAQEESSKPKLERSEMGLLEKIQFIVDNDFKRVSYTEAIDILRNSKPNKKKKFKYIIEEWGADLQSEHERYLVEKHFKTPVILFDYPAKIKAFYMRMNDDGKTVRAMDILFPGIGEMVGGSQREERLDVLQERIKAMGIEEEELWWYLDLRKFGSAPHSGFGLGFERLVLFATGMGNIRDVIPFPRTPQNASF